MAKKKSDSGWRIKGELALNEWLGLEEELQSAWADDRPQVMTEEELRKLIGEVRPGLFGELVRLGMR